MDVKRLVRPFLLFFLDPPPLPVAFHCSSALIDTQSRATGPFVSSFARPLLTFSSRSPSSPSQVYVSWSSDPYSLGGPAWWRPGFASKYQDELQSRHGNVLFASADWAHGWRAAIDGALEQGTLNAAVVTREIRELGKTGKAKL
jgi:hypothetical protein